MNWNIDETPYPGPDDGVEARTLLITQRDTWTRTGGTGHDFFTATIEANDWKWLAEINDLVEVVSLNGTVMFTGYLNQIEIETMFRGGGQQVKVQLSSKKIAPSYG